ncbi:MAG: hypothetical protein ACPGQS_07085, partial [Bradymonadia bacterium]
MLSACSSDRNIAPDLSVPTRALFSIGVENTLNLVGGDSDGDQVSFDFRFLDEGAETESLGNTDLVQYSSGAVFTWRLGVDETRIVGRSYRVEFEVKDTQGGRTRKITEILIVDPYLYGARELRLNRRVPDGFISTERCVEPVDIGLISEGGFAIPKTFQLSFGPLDCPEGERCVPALETLGMNERRLVWCATDSVLERSRDHEIDLSVGGTGAPASFSIPLVFRFLDGAGEAHGCDASIAPQFQVVEAAFAENYADVRIAVEGVLGEDPMISVLRADGSLFTRSDLHGAEAFRLSHIGGDQWRVRLSWSFAVTEGDRIDLVLTSRQHADGCIGVQHSDAVSLNVSRLKTNAELAGDVCAACQEDDDCQGGACVVVNGQGRCAQSCLAHSECPEGFLCTSVRSIERTQSNQCLPTSGRCVSGCGSTLIEQSRPAVDIGTNAEVEVNLCSGRVDQFTVNVPAGEGVRVLVDDIESMGIRGSVGLSVWLKGVESWDSWHSTSTSTFELKCAVEEVSLTAELWRWWGTGLHHLVTERIEGGCPNSCSDDVFEREMSATTVESSTRYSGL